MHLLLLAVWFLALGLVAFLALDLVVNRRAERRERKAAGRRLRTFEKYRRSQKIRREQIHKVEGAGGSPGVVGGSLRLGLVIFGLVVLVLWELYWVSQIAKARDPTQLPLLFLFLMMIVIPAIVYIFSRRILWRQ